MLIQRRCFNHNVNLVIRITDGPLVSNNSLFLFSLKIMLTGSRRESTFLCLFAYTRTRVYPAALYAIENGIFLCVCVCAEGMRTKLLRTYRLLCAVHRRMNIIAVAWRELFIHRPQYDVLLITDNRVECVVPCEKRGVGNHNYTYVRHRG